jgi:hypothetical protein
VFVAGVLGGDRFDQDDPGFFCGGGIVADAAGDDEELTRQEGDRAAIRFRAAYGEGTAKDEKHLILKWVRVPGKFSVDTRDLYILIVDLSEDSRRPQLRKGATREFEREGMLHEPGRLVAEAGGDGDLVAALGATAAEHSSASLGGHANEEAMNLGATAAIGLEGALGHLSVPV